MRINIIGAGLAGCEAALYLAKRGVPVTLYEQKPHAFSPAHHSAGFAELVCKARRTIRRALPSLCARTPSRPNGWIPPAAF